MKNLKVCFGIALTALMIAFVPPVQSESEVDIAISDVPLKVITAARKEIFAIQFTEAELIKQADGRLIYELEGTKDKVTYVVQIDTEGKVIRTGVEGDFEEERKERNLSKLPLVVKEAVEKKMEGIRLIDFATEREYGQLVYEVEGIVDGQCYEVEVTPEGAVLETEDCD